MKIPKLTPVQEVCCTSVSDGICTLKNMNNLDVARQCLKYELDHMCRTTMVKCIKAEIRRRDCYGCRYNGWTTEETGYHYDEPPVGIERDMVEQEGECFYGTSHGMGC